MNQWDNRLIAAAVLAAGDVAYEWDLASDRLLLTASADQVFGAGAAELLVSGEAFSSRISSEDLPHRLQHLAEHYRIRGTLDCEYRLRRTDGEFCWVHDRGAAEFGAGGRPLRLRGVLRSVQERKQNEARLERLTSYDELTGHFNRSRLRQALHQMILHSQRYGPPGAYLSVGIDKLSLINDAYDIATADAVIKQAGQRLEQVMRVSDVLGRVGGDVYGLALSQCPESCIPTVAEKILRAFRDQPLETPSGPIHVTVSIGAVTFPSGVQMSFEAMTRAEAAMREAKQLGRDCFHVHKMNDRQRQDHCRAMVIGEEIKRAIKEDRLMFAFQPVVRATDFMVEFYECLLRMRSLDGEIVPAFKFVPIIERLGLTRLMDRHVLELAFKELVAHPDVRLALNISGFTAADPGWLRRAISLFAGRPDIARRLIIEITETAAVQDIDETARFVTTVRDLGCQVALDDFGAGYTSFRHLKGLTIDIVKIDGSFVLDVATNDDNRVFVRTLLGLAKSFGLRTVAECVETHADALILREEGVDWLQGYFFAKPSLDRLWLQPNGGVGVPARPHAEAVACDSGSPVEHFTVEYRVG